MNKIVLLFCIIFLVNNLSAQCSENQININSASAEELDKIVWVGNATANAIINSRPFSSVDDLLKVKGIGETKLADIKQENLACVGEEKKSSSKENSSKEITSELNILTTEEENSEEIIKKEIQTIDLTRNSVENNSQKDIKINNVKDGLNKKAVYGLAGFCILLGVLFLIKNKKTKNEFR